VHGEKAGGSKNPKEKNNATIHETSSAVKWSGLLPRECRPQSAEGQGESRPKHSGRSLKLGGMTFGSFLSSVRSLARASTKERSRNEHLWLC
jgi:hypothetical protein